MKKRKHLRDYKFHRSRIRGFHKFWAWAQDCAGLRVFDVFIHVPLWSGELALVDWLGAGFGGWCFERVLTEDRTQYDEEAQIFGKGTVDEVRSLFFRLRYAEDWAEYTLIDMYVVDRLGDAGIRNNNRYSVRYLFRVEVYEELTRIIEVVVESGPNRTLPSLCEFWASAEWLEREIFEFTGIKFRGHPDLRRLLSDYGFKGFPLQKDFPVVGFEQVKYDEQKRATVYERLFLTQQEREVEFVNPWVLEADKSKGSVNRNKWMAVGGRGGYGGITFKNTGENTMSTKQWVETFEKISRNESRTRTWVTVPAFMLKWLMVGPRQDK